MATIELKIKPAPNFGRIEKVLRRGRWALGTGNSVAKYIPVENFLAMQEEGYLAGRC